MLYCSLVKCFTKSRAIEKLSTIYLLYKWSVSIWHNSINKHSSHWFQICTGIIHTVTKQLLWYCNGEVVCSNPFLVWNINFERHFSRPIGILNLGPWQERRGIQEFILKGQKLSTNANFDQQRTHTDSIHYTVKGLWGSNSGYKVGLYVYRGQIIYW